MTELAYPPPPWLLHGRAMVIPALVRAPRAGRRAAILRTPGGFAPGGLLLAAYDPESTLTYHELLGVGGVMWDGVVPAAWITHAHVDDATSIAGGHAIWGIPKREGDFRWSRTPAGEEVTVSLAGREIVAVTVARRRGAVTVPIAAPFVGRDGRRRAWAAGRLRGAPVTVRVDLPPGSPLAALSPVFAGTAVVGEVTLRVGAPRAGRSGRRGGQPAALVS